MPSTKTKRAIAALGLVALMLTTTAGQADAATFTFAPAGSNRILSAAPTTNESNAFFSTWFSSPAHVNTQRTLVSTPTATFQAQLLSNLGPLGPGQSYLINSATLTAGGVGDDYTNLATAHQLLTTYNPATVTWTNFNSGGVVGTQYNGPSSATSVASGSSASWDLTADVRNWLNGTTNNGLLFRSGETTTATGNPTFTAASTVQWTLNAQISNFQPFFYDPFAGQLGGVGAPNSLASTATTASPKVGDYKVDTGVVDLVANGAAGSANQVGITSQALNLFGGANTAGALHQNLTTVAGATYSVTLDAALWGSNAGSNAYTLSVSAFDGIDTISGTPLGSDLINTAAGFTTEHIYFTFVAGSTSTTLYLNGSITNTTNKDLWIDNLRIMEDLSTVAAVPEPGSLTLFGVLSVMTVLGLAWRQRRGSRH